MGRRREHFLAVDIGSSTAIRSLLFNAEAGECVALAKRHFELPASADGDRLITLTVGHLKRLISSAISEIGRRPDGTLIGLGNHLTAHEIAVAEHNRLRPAEPITKAELQLILREYLRSHRERSIDGQGWHLAELMPLHVEVDGYPLEALTSQSRGRKAAIALLSTYARHRYWTALSALRSALPGLKIRFTSDRAAVVSALHNRGIHDAMIIKVGARITEVSVLSRGAILSTGQFERGGEDITAGLAEGLGIGRREAENIKRHWGQIPLPPRSKDTARAAITAAAGAWLEALSDFLKGQAETVIPGRVFLLGGGSRLKALGEVMSARPWQRGLTYRDKIEVRRLDAEDVTPAMFRNFSPQLTGPEETALAAIAWRLAA